MSKSICKEKRLFFLFLTDRGRSLRHYTAVANATDAASVITQLNALLARLRTIGLIANS
jgi:hypothetical protein